MVARASCWRSADPDFVLFAGQTAGGGSRLFVPNAAQTSHLLLCVRGLRIGKEAGLGGGGPPLCDLGLWWKMGHRQHGQPGSCVHSLQSPLDPFTLRAARLGARAWLSPLGPAQRCQQSHRAGSPGSEVWGGVPCGPGAGATVEVRLWCG